MNGTTNSLKDKILIERKISKVKNIRFIIAILTSNLLVYLFSSQPPSEINSPNTFDKIEANQVRIKIPAKSLIDNSANGIQSISILSNKNNFKIEKAKLIKQISNDEGEEYIVEVSSIEGQRLTAHINDELIIAPSMAEIRVVQKKIIQGNQNEIVF
jgi:hypothetical protein